jgi:beta-1,4-galactosyltransferase 1
MNENKKLCVVIPYRDRLAHLKALLPALKICLENADLEYQILVVEQENGKKFNRGMMKNIGASWAIENQFDYICFHDVDMIPVLGKVDYSYENFAVHLAVEVQQFGYKLAYDTFFGGVLLITKEDLIKSNGYRNDYWSWGAEDDDFYTRCVYSGVSVKRKACRFNSFDHARDIISEDYQKNLQTLRDFWKDPSTYISNGLNTLEYEVNFFKEEMDEKVNFKKLNVKV